jgi:hypothetical protein
MHTHRTAQQQHHTTSAQRRCTYTSLSSAENASAWHGSVVDTSFVLNSKLCMSAMPYTATVPSAVATATSFAFHDVARAVTASRLWSLLSASPSCSDMMTMPLRERRCSMPDASPVTIIVVPHTVDTHVYPASSPNAANAIPGVAIGLQTVLARELRTKDSRHVAGGVTQPCGHGRLRRL